MKPNNPLVLELMQTSLENCINADRLDSHKSDLFSKFIEGTLFVTDYDNKLVGILTDGDVRKSVANETILNIKEIITKTPKIIYKDEEASVALRIIRENGINILPVLDRDDTLIGYITLHMLINSFSPERLYITDENENEDDNVSRHLARYHFALNFIKQDSISLDCACGSGYGSRIIAQKSKEVLAIDLSEEAISFANENNKVKQIQYIQNDISKLSFKNDNFDNIISIETLEHVPFDIFTKFLNGVQGWLKSGGIFIGSSPMLRYKDGKPYITNPYHINEMPRDVFQKEIESRLKDFTIHYYYQNENTFLPLQSENTGFCIVVARKR